MSENFKKLYEDTKDLSQYIKDTSERLEIALKRPKGVDELKSLINMTNSSETQLKSIRSQCEKLVMSATNENELQYIDSSLTIIENLEDKVAANLEKSKSLKSFLILSGFNLKGGSLKSSFNRIIAGLLAKEKGKRVLLIDGDYQANLSRVFDPDKKLPRDGVKQIFEDRVELEAIVYPTEIDNIDLVTNSIFYDEIVDYISAKNAGREFLFRNYIKDNMEYLNANYDYIIIDIGPRTDILNRNFFLEIDSFIFTTLPDEDSLDGIASFEKSYYKNILPYIEKIQKFGLVIGRAKSNTNVAKNFIEKLRTDKDKSSMLIEPVIPDTVEFDSFKEKNKVLEKKDSEKLYSVYMEILNEMERRELI